MAFAGDIGCGNGVGSSVVAVADPPRHAVVLTYDDGPEPGGTDRILRVLDESAATATFFVLISRVRRYPSLLREVLSAGHEIGLHGLDHRRLTRLTAMDARLRTVAARSELEDATGRAVRWFRPPYGSQSASTWRAVTDAGMTPVLWQVECREWLPIPDAERLAGVRALCGEGAVVLAHDGCAGPLDGVDDPSPPPIDRGAFTRSLITVCDDNGWACMSLAAALGTGRLVVRTWLDPETPTANGNACVPHLQNRTAGGHDR